MMDSKSRWAWSKKSWLRQSVSSASKPTILMLGIARLSRKRETAASLPPLLHHIADAATRCRGRRSAFAAGLRGVCAVLVGGQLAIAVGVGLVEHGGQPGQ